MVNWFISSSVLILVVIALRLLLKGKISLRLQYALWALVLVRLLVPFSIGEARMSIGTWLDEMTQTKEVHEIYEFTQAELTTMSYQQAYEEVADKYADQGIDIESMPENEFATTIDYEIMETMTAKSFSLAEIAKAVWIFGGVAVGTWFLITNFRFQKKLMMSRKLLELGNESTASFKNEVLERCKNKVPIYISDEIDTPCLFGLFYPTIYVTSEVVEHEGMLRHVLAHEMTHYLHMDYIWGYIRALCLAIHWFNPLVWCAAVLSRNDAELACDEIAIKRLGENERASYGRTLIGLTCEKPTAVLLTATTMTGSGKAIKERISMIVKKPKMKGYVGILVAVVSILCVGCTFTGADTGKEKQDADINTQIDTTETENTLIGTITEIPEGVSEEEQEKIRIEMELRQEEAEQQREVLEKMVEFYRNIENGTRVTDEDIINRINNFLQDENEFDRMLNCEYGYDGTQNKYQINGYTVFLVDEASAWEYYEELARKYYSESYIESEFTPFFLGNVYMEEDGKLYRTLADGIVNPIVDSTLEVWLADSGKYYVSIVVDSVDGEYYSQGYILDLSEDSIYGFEIVEKVHLLSVKEDVTYVIEGENTTIVEEAD